MILTPSPQGNHDPLSLPQLFVAYNLIRPDDEAPITFSCSGRQGALLYLPFLAERQDTIARGDFAEWILENIDACFKVAVDLGCGVDRMEDIILVTGCHLAKSWANVAFSENRGGAQVSFGVQVSFRRLFRRAEREWKGFEAWSKRRGGALHHFEPSTYA